MISYIEGEPRGKPVQPILREALASKTALLISAIQWGEVIYTFHDRYGSEKCDAVEKALSLMPLQVVDVDINITRLASNLKIVNKLHYADAFVAALALNRNAELVTGDRDFKRVEDKVRIRWL